MVPDPLPGGQVRRVGRELLHMYLPCPTFRQKRAHVPLVKGRAVPDHHQLLRHVRQQVLEEEHAKSPRNPYAFAPWDNSSGITCSCSGMSLTGPVGRGLARQASEPRAQASATHWLSAAAETPKAAAISHCFHPCCLSSSARLRRPSFQVLGKPYVRSRCGV